MWLDREAGVRNSALKVPYEYFSLEKQASVVNSILNQGVYDKNSNIVFIMYAFYGSVVSNQVFFSVPPKYRPKTNISGLMGMRVNDGTFTFGTVTIEATTGYLKHAITSQENGGGWGIIRYPIS